MSNRVSVFVIFTSAYFLSYFFRSANAVIAPDLAHEFALDARQLGLMTSLFFAVFAAVQLPLGIGLDRIGPRRVTSGLMVAGAAGSVIFAFAHGFGALAVGRALIGLGMAGVLMGALKAFSQWYSPHSYSSLSGLLVGIGSAGALVAATPLALLNASIGWRAAFMLGAGVTLLVATAIVLWTRDTPPGMPWTGRTAGYAALRTIVADTRFWRMALLVFFANGTLLAFQGLWAGPYLNDLYAVDAVTRGNVLFLLSVGVTAGFLSSGWLSSKLGLTNVIITGSLLFVVAQVVLALHPPLPITSVTFFVFGLTGGLTIMLLAQPRYVFPLTMTGQATTAVNLFSVGGAALVQWWIGVIVSAFPTAGAHYPPEAYSAALAVCAAGTAGTLLFYLPMRRNSIRLVATAAES